MKWGESHLHRAGCRNAWSNTVKVGKTDSTSTEGCIVIPQNSFVQCAAAAEET